ncbi:calcitonin gene-related peptide type 1 receptor isoform X2 [Anguilla rostrata]
MKRQQSSLVVLLLLLLLVFFQDCVCGDGSPAALSKGQPTVPNSTSVRSSRIHILAAQFECYLKIINDPPRSDGGVYCNRTWDGWLCWGDSSPGVAVQICPDYFHDFDPSEKVTKVCDSDGQWFRHPESSRIWSNYTQCTAYTMGKRQLALSSYYLAIVGHVLSLVSLLISLAIFSYFKNLSCQRVSLHKNMFLSFIFNSILTVIWLSVVVHGQHLVAINSIGCKILSSLISYALGSIYFWMLCEGIYLHTLIVVAVFMGEQHLGWYYVLGWGFPLVPAVTHAVARWLYFDDKCWISSDTNLVYIIHSPIYAALLANLFFLLNIMRVLITKLRVTHSAQSNMYMKVVRGTLLLVPLLGIQFILVPSRPQGRLLKAVYEFVMNIFTHYQGLQVAIIFCFCNGEVQTALKRHWAQYRFRCKGPLATNDSHSNGQTSITEMSRAVVSLKPQKPLPPLEPDNKQANGQSNGQCSSNGQRHALETLESTVI